ncbi:MAG: GGDEF domain-containing protein [Pseudomonadota bacterium]|nr:GGDEF domain-containing protein [Pseudomonadota bacterium]
MEIMEEKKTNSLLDDLVRAEKLQLLYHQSYPAIFASLLNSILLAAILWPVQRKEVLISWVFILACTAVVRIILFNSYNRIKPQGEDVLAWEKPYFLTLLLSSITWGIGAVYIMPIGSQLHQVVIYYFLMGMSGGAISVYSANRSMTLITIACLLLPVTGWFLIQGNLLPVGLAIGAVIFFVSAIRAGKILSLKLNQSFMLTHELKDAKETAEARALMDELSGLNNRRAFYDKGRLLVDYYQRHDAVLSVIVMDLDHFKKINDKFGHAAGDATIRQVGHILQQVIRKSDLCARIGGEEFGILLTTSVNDGAAQLAEKLRQMIAGTPIVFDGEDFSVSASFGVAVGNADLETLLKRADAALYKAKDAGRNRVISDGCVAEEMQGCICKATVTPARLRAV